MLAAEAGSVTPGDEVRSVVLVRNTGAVADEFHVVIQGRAAQWASVSPNLLRLEPGEEAPAWLTFAPPRRSDTVTGLQTYSVAVTCRSDPDFVALEEGVIEVAPYQELAARLSPPGEQVRRTIPYTLTVANRGNGPSVVSVRALATDPGLAFSVDPAQVEIPAGEACEFDIGVHRPRRFLPGGGDPRRFALRIATGGADVAIIEAALEGESALARDLKRSAIILAIVLVLVVLVGQAILDESTGPVSSSPGVTLATDPPTSAPTDTAEGQGPVIGEVEHGTPTTAAPGRGTVASVGRMALVRSYDDGKDIVVREPGGGETRLVSKDVEERRPALSPDGQRVAFVGTEVSKATRVCVIPAAGGVYYCLADAALDSSLAWSDDGGTLFFARDQTLHSVPVVVPPAPAPQPTNLGVEVTGNRFSMNPDRSAVVTAIPGGLVIRPVGGGQEVALAAHGQPGNAAWSSDGSLVAFDDGNDLWVTDARAGGAPRRLHESPTVETEPAWTADGRYVVYRNNRTGKGDIYAIAVAGAGTAPVRLTDHDGADLTPAL